MAATVCRHKKNKKKKLGQITAPPFLFSLLILMNTSAPADTLNDTARYSLVSLLICLWNNYGAFKLSGSGGRAREQQHWCAVNLSASSYERLLFWSELNREMPLFSGQKEANGEKRLLSTKLVCVWCMYMCFGEGWGWVFFFFFFGCGLPKSGCLHSAFIACSKFNDNMINICR